MGVIEEVNKLHITLKSIIISLTLIMPFWYFNLYYFHPIFFKEAPIQIPIVASFCISVVWVGTHFLSASAGSALAYSKKDNKTAKPENKLLESRLMVAVLLSLFWVVVFTILGYWYKWNFMTILKYSFLFWTLRFSVVLFFTWAFKKVDEVSKTN